MYASLLCRRLSTRPGQTGAASRSVLWHDHSGLRLFGSHFGVIVCAVLAASGGFLLPLTDQAETSITRPHFTDIAPRSKIPYVTNNDFQGRKYFQQPMCGGIAILDYDRDG